MTVPRHTRFFHACLIFWFLFSCTALAQNEQSASNSKRSVPPAIVAKFSQLKEYEQRAVYWTAEAGWHTELQLRNNLETQNLTVTPVLRTFDGAEAALAAVMIRPNDVASINLADALVNQAPGLIGTYGSVVLRYRSPVPRALYAAVMIHLDGHPIEFHLDPFFPQKDWQSGSQEGIWWIGKNSASDYLVLSNTADANLKAKLLIYDSAGHPWQEDLSFGPRETKRLSVGTLVRQAGFTSSYGGIKIDMQQGAGYFDAAHFLFDEMGGFSALMKMFDHNPQETVNMRSLPGAKEWTIRAPMLALSNSDPALGFPAGTTLQPKIFVHNTSSKAYRAQMRFNWWSGTGTGKTTTMPVTLTPHQTQIVDVAGLQTQKTLPFDAYWASVILSGPMQPNELIAIAASYDSTGRYGAQTPFDDQLGSSLAAGKWEADSLHNSIITVGDGGQAPARAQITFSYNAGQGKYQVEQVLNPDEQIWLDLGKIIRDQIPDKDGKTLPPDVTSGVYQIEDLDHIILGPLYEAKLIVDNTNGHASYGCYLCCGADGLDMGIDPMGLVVTGTGDQSVWSANECSGHYLDLTGAMSSWGTNNHAIATASNALITGVGVGSTNQFASGEVSKSGFRQCPEYPETSNGGTNVVPSISQNQNLWYFGNGISTPQGFTLGGTTATLTASGGGSGDYVWSVTNGSTTAALQGTTSGQNVTSVQIASTSYSTSANDVTVQLQYTPTGGSAITATHSLTVDSPYKLVAGTITDDGVTGPSCVSPPSGTTGYLSTIPYTLTSFLGVSMSFVPVNETFSGLVDDYIGNNWPSYVPQSGSTSFSGAFVDRICALQGGLTPPPLPPQNGSTKIDHGNQALFAGSSNEAEGVEVQSDTLQRYQDHGRHLSIVSPVR